MENTNKKSRPESKTPKVIKILKRGVDICDFINFPSDNDDKKFSVGKTTGKISYNDVPEERYLNKVSEMNPRNISLNTKLAEKEMIEDNACEESVPKDALPKELAIENNHENNPEDLSSNINPQLAEMEIVDTTCDDNLTCEETDVDSVVFKDYKLNNVSKKDPVNLIPQFQGTTVDVDKLKRKEDIQEFLNSDLMSEEIPVPQKCVKFTTTEDLALYKEDLLKTLRSLNPPAIKYGILSEIIRAHVRYHEIVIQFHKVKEEMQRYSGLIREKLQDRMNADETNNASGKPQGEAEKHASPIQKDVGLNNVINCLEKTNIDGQAIENNNIVEPTYAIENNNIDEPTQAKQDYEDKINFEIENNHSNI